MDALGNPSMYSWFIKKFTIDFSCLKSSVAREAIGLLFAIEHYEKWLQCPVTSSLMFCSKRSNWTSFCNRTLWEVVTGSCNYFSNVLQQEKQLDFFCNRTLWEVVTPESMSLSKWHYSPLFCGTQCTNILQ